MARTTKDTLTFTRQVINHDTHEIIEEEYVHRQGPEPTYIKLYVETLMTFKGLSKTLNPILIAFLKHMSYAEDGQLIFVNKGLKLRVAEMAGVSLKRVEAAMTAFTKAKIWERVGEKGSGTYRVNPYLIGKGDWSSIKKIRATFDFNTGEVKAEFNEEAAADIER